MNTKNNSLAVKTLATGLIVGSVAVATLATSGCDKLSAEQAVTGTSGSPESAADPLGVGEKPDVRTILAANHNETFLVTTTA